MKRNKGFSTVELLVTLFVASAFLLAGYQLYAMVIKDGGETKQQAIASNKAYEYLQKYKAHATFIANPCAQHNVTSADENLTPTIPGLSNTNLEIAISCPGLQNTIEAKYYNDYKPSDFSAIIPYAIRNESVINHDWQLNSPIEGMLIDHFSARWTASFIAKKTGPYSFQMSHDDGFKLYIDGVKVKEYWYGTYEIQTEYSFDNVVANSTKEIVLEYYEEDGKAAMKLNWKEPSETEWKLFTPNAGATTNETPSLSKVSVTLKYGTATPQKQVVQATYVNKE